MSEKRLMIYIIAIMTMFIGILIPLFLLSSNLELRTLAAKQSEAVINLSQGRGEIYDCNLYPLTSTTSNVYALAVSGEAAYSEYFRRLNSEDQKLAYELYDQTTPYLIELDTIEEDSPFEFFGTSRYIDQQIASNTIGYLDNNANGAQGIEKAFNDILVNGGVERDISYSKDALGELMMHSEPDLMIDYGTGQGIILTIDSTIQRIAEGIAAANIEKGAIVIMESKTGRIKASVSMPTLYPNNIVKNIEDNDTAFINRPSTAFNVGSVIKPFIAAELLEQGVDKNEVYECYGSIQVSDHSYRCFTDYGHGEVDMTKAIAVSCNGYFIDQGLQLSPKTLQQIGIDIGLGLGVTSEGYVVSEDGYLPTEDELTDLGERASYSFGQGMLMATPIQMAAAFNIFANDGTYISPTLVEGIYNQFTDTVDESFYAPVMRRVISSDTAQEVGDMLEQVITHGTTDEAAPLFGMAAGKSGTAQTGRYMTDEYGLPVEVDKEPVDETVAWFVGFYPADDPIYTIAVMQDSADKMGEDMGELFADICNSLRYFDSALPNSDGNQQVSVEDEDAEVEISSEQQPSEVGEQ